MPADCKLGTYVLESSEGISDVRKCPKFIPYRENSDVQGKAFICTKNIYRATSWATLTPVLWQFSGGPTRNDIALSSFESLYFNTAYS